MFTKLLDALKATRRTIVFTEGPDARILEATDRLLKEDLMDVILIGNADEVKAGAILEREKKLKGLIFLGGRFDYTPGELALIGVPYVCCSYTNCFGSLRERDYSSRFAR